MENKTALHISVKGSGDSILLIHGIISDGSFFHATGDILADHYEVITYDRRGYGESNREDYSDFSVSEQAKDAASVLESCGGRPAWVVGNSAGGLIALELALQRPDLVKGLILVEPSLGYDPEEYRKLKEWNQELNGYVQEKKIKRALPAFVRVIGDQESSGNGVSLAEIKRTYQNLEAFMHGELNEVQNYLPPLELLKELKIPSVIAVTEKGRNSIFATSSATAAELIGWQVIHFPGYHNAAKDMPVEFAYLVRGVFEDMKRKREE